MPYNSEPSSNTIPHTWRLAALATTLLMFFEKQNDCKPVEENAANSQIKQNQWRDMLKPFGLTPITLLELGRSEFGHLINFQTLLVNATHICSLHFLFLPY